MVTLTVNFSAAVTVNTTGGTPTLTLNDGGTATYAGGSGTTALTFSYTVAAGQNTPDLVVSAFNLNGATVKDGAGNAADLSGATNYNPAGTLQIEHDGARRFPRSRPPGTGITNGSGDLSAGQVVTLTVNLSEAVTVNTTGGTPTLTLNDGGTASLYRRLGHHRAHLQLHGRGRAEHARPRRILVQSQWRDREGRRRQRGRPVRRDQ